MERQQKEAMMKRHNGFTLIEILVVVGIIALLISILLPALGAAKKRAQSVDTAAEMASIQQGLMGYAQLFGNYPGPLPESTIAAGGNITANQNLTLGASRGWNPAPIPAGMTALTLTAPLALGSGVTADTSGQTAMMDWSNGKALQPFVQLKATDYYTKGPYPGALVTLAAFPVIIDRYADPLPILYYRKTPGVDSLPLKASPAAGYAAYYTGSNSAFANSATLQSAKGGTFKQALSDADLTLELTNNNQPRGGFVLISAGLDRVYGKLNGTATDDIIVEGGN